MDHAVHSTNNRKQSIKGRPKTRPSNLIAAPRIAPSKLTIKTLQETPVQRTRGYTHPPRVPSRAGISILKRERGKKGGRRERKKKGKKKKRKKKKRKKKIQSVAKFHRQSITPPPPPPPPESFRKLSSRAQPRTGAADRDDDDDAKMAEGVKRGGEGRRGEERRAKERTRRQGAWRGREGGRRAFGLHDRVDALEAFRACGGSLSSRLYVDRKSSSRLRRSRDARRAIVDRVIDESNLDVAWSQFFSFLSLSLSLSLSFSFFFLSFYLSSFFFLSLSLSLFISLSFSSSAPRLEIQSSGDIVISTVKKKKGVARGCCEWWIPFPPFTRRRNG